MSIHRKEETSASVHTTSINLGFSLIGKNKQQVKRRSLVDNKNLTKAIVVLSKAMAGGSLKKNLSLLFRSTLRTLLTEISLSLKKMNLQSATAIFISKTENLNNHNLGWNQRILRD